MRSIDYVYERGMRSDSRGYHTTSDGSSLLGGDAFLRLLLFYFPFISSSLFFFFHGKRKTLAGRKPVDCLITRMLIKNVLQFHDGGREERADRTFFSPKIFHVVTREMIVKVRRTKRGRGIEIGIYSLSGHNTGDEI